MFWQPLLLLFRPAAFARHKCCYTGRACSIAVLYPVIDNPTPLFAIVHSTTAGIAVSSIISWQLPFAHLAKPANPSNSPKPTPTAIGIRGIVWKLRHGRMSGQLATDKVIQNHLGNGVQIQLTALKQPARLARQHLEEPDVILEPAPAPAADLVGALDVLWLAPG